MKIKESIHFVAKLHVLNEMGMEKVSDVVNSILILFLTKLFKFPCTYVHFAPATAIRM